ncbi:MAG: DUF3880 domain-containing protein [Lachnospiraceae bacterium]|nr:DUF3880 domain-containing protein [Lachnospiraceae bacterium]
MKILIYEWENFGGYDIKEAFEKEGLEVSVVKTTQEELLSEGIKEKIKADAKIYSPDIFYTFNYFPMAAMSCKDIGLEYYSWVYDNPAVSLFSFTVIYPTNHIFVFDSDTYLYFNQRGIKTIEYLPMAVNPDRIERLLSENKSAAKAGGESFYRADISFVGSLYTEKHCFYDRMNLSGYTDGYVRGVMEAQKKIYGDNIVEKLLTKDIVDDMYKSLPLEPAEGSCESKEYLFAQYVINRKITQEERLSALTRLGKSFKVDLYTPDKNRAIEGCENHGPADFFEETPRIFATSKINLNITLRSIVNGIPLRCFDIMGSGGFLLSNYQEDFLRYFEPDADFVYYDGEADMISKAEYYLSHDDEREAIAACGFKKIKEAHTFRHRVKQMLLQT